jgi:hypothetical protein
VAALVMAWFLLPAHVNEATDPVDNIGGVLSVLGVGALVLGINFAPVPGDFGIAVAIMAVGVVMLLLFFLRQRAATYPLYDLDVAARRLFWVAAVGGIIVFGSLMAAMFIGQQYLQDVLGYSSFEAGAAILPAVALMVIAAPRSAKLVQSVGSRHTLLLGYTFCLLGFVTMFLFWKSDTNYFFVALAYGLVGLGVGFAGTPASNSLTGSVPVERAGMASGTADLQRDLGGAIMQSILGALLTAGYASAVNSAISSASPVDQALITDNVQSELTKSFASAAQTAERHPAFAQQIIDAARDSFVDGQDWAYLAGIIAILAGAVVIAVLYPKHERELALLDEYHRIDGQVAPVA